jgi:hypothetical protein
MPLSPMPDGFESPSRTIHSFIARRRFPNAPQSYARLICCLIIRSKLSVWHLITMQEKMMYQQGQNIFSPIIGSMLKSISVLFAQTLNEVSSMA